MMYARAMALQCSQRKYDTKNLMAHELSPRPASMCDDSGAMKAAKTTAILKNDLKVEVARRHVAVDASFSDGCAVMWLVSWPIGGIVQDVLNKFRRHIQGHLESSDVYLVFDRYTAGSINESTRNDRDQGASRVYEPRPLARLPAHNIVLTVSRNKTQLVDLIMEDLQAHKDVLNGKLVITGNDQGVVSKIKGMPITHEDTMIIHQVANVGVNNVLVVADDTDIFVLLCHFVFRGDITGHVMIISPIRGRTVIDINASVDKNPADMEDILAAHGLSGCDTERPPH